MIEVEDLVGRPYHSGRCIGAVRAVLHRKFPGFKDDEIPDTPDEAERWLRNRPARWEEVGRSIHAAQRDGDVIYGITEDDFGRQIAFVVVVVDQIGRIGFTATPERDFHARPLRGLMGVLSVQRRIA